jgi:photosystem II stability/assembly factor-like uncharacterized protein
VFALAVDPLTPSTVYAGTGRSCVIRTTDRAASWRADGTGGCLPLPVGAFTTDPSAPGTLYAATQGSGSFIPHGQRLFYSGFSLHRTTDFGATWTPAGEALATTFQERVIRSLAVDPVAPSTVYVGSSDGILSSLDHGASFAEMNTGLPTDARDRQVTAIAFDSLSTVFIRVAAALAFHGTVFRRTSGDTSWSPLDDRRVDFPLVVDPSSPSTLYAALEDGVGKSTDGGLVWRHADSGITGLQVVSLALDPRAPGRLYAIVSEGAAGTGAPNVFTTPDGGQTWNRAAAIPDEQASPADFAWQVLTVDPATSAVYAMNRGCDVFVAPVGATAWTLLPKLDPSQNDCSLGVDPAGRALYLRVGNVPGFRGLARLELVPCSSPVDCDDGNPCTDDVCVATVCANSPVADGTRCDDGDPGTVNACVGATCRPTALVHTRVRIRRGGHTGRVRVSGEIRLGPVPDHVDASAGLVVTIKAAGGFSATRSWAAAACRVTSAGVECMDSQEAARLAINTKRRRGRSPRLSANLKGLAIATVPAGPVAVTLAEAGHAIDRMSLLTRCTRRTKTLICREPRPARSE